MNGETVHEMPYQWLQCYRRNAARHSTKCYFPHILFYGDYTARCGKVYSSHLTFLVPLFITPIYYALSCQVLIENRSVPFENQRIKMALMPFISAFLIQSASHPALPCIRSSCRRHLESVFSYRLSWNHRQQLQKRKSREEERIRRRLIHDSYKDLVHGVEAGGREYAKYYKYDTKIGQIISYNLHHHCHRHCCLPESYFFSRSLHRPRHCRRAYPLDFR